MGCFVDKQRKIRNKFLLRDKHVITLMHHFYVHSFLTLAKIRFPRESESLFHIVDEGGNDVSVRGEQSEVVSRMEHGSFCINFGNLSQERS